jgi:hypothetical protein
VLTGGTTSAWKGPLRRAVPWLAGAAWIAGVAMGFGELCRYATGPGAIAAAPLAWPDAAALPLDAERPTLVMFAHPHCACTKASLAELDRALAQCGGAVAATVLFYCDPALGPQWERTSSWDRAAAIPGVCVRRDPLGETARAFAATTSGLVVLYGTDGRLRFYGGITSARGHEGDSAGAAELVQAVRGDGGEVHTAAVYGCALVDDGGISR